MAQIGVQILGDSTSLERAFKRSEVAAAEFNGRMSAASQAARGALSTTGGGGKFLFGSSEFVAAALAATAITKSVNAASDLNEQIQKAQVVFGEAAQSILDFGDSAARSLGISKRQAIAAAGTFGNLFKTVDLLPEENAKLSQSLVQLAGDLASFNNTNPEDALLALRSALVGEVEPLRRYGARLSEARVQQQALADSGKTNVKQLTEQEKVLARVKIIFQDTTAAQGDVARTSSSFANQTRQLRANIDDLEASLGSLLIPTLADLTQSLNDGLTAAKKLEDGLIALKDIGPIDIPIDINATFFFKGATGRDVGGTFGAIKKRVGEAVESGLSAGIKPVQDLIEGAKNGQIGKGFTFFPSSPSTRRGRAEGRSSQDVQNERQQREREEREAIREAKARAARLRKQFDALSKGLGLKLDKAALSGSVDAQISVLREFERAILRQERKVGKTFELEDKLTQVRQQIQNLQDQKQRDALQKQEDQERKILALKEKQKQKLQEQLAKQRELRQQAKAALDEATAGARSLFGTLFQVPEQAQRTLTILGGSRGRQQVILPGAGGGQDAGGLLSDLTTQIKSFKTLQASILELQKKGAPGSLLKAARSGEISADQINALAKADSKTLNAIFRNVRLADKLVSRAAKAEINAKDVTLNARTVTIKGAGASTGFGGGDSGHGHGDIVIHHQTVVDGKVVENSLTRRKKKRSQQRRGRTSGHR